MRTHDLAELARVVGAQAPSEQEHDLLVGPDVVIDSRRATPGALFVALPGEHVDGHDYAGAAAQAGAVAVLAQRPVAADVATLVVDDAVEGLSRLGRHVVSEAKQRGLKVFALTGSSGKTSTKDLLAQVLEAHGPTVAPVGSFNNEIGVPLTACRVDEHTRHLVSEMGARGPGHIAWLCSMTPPDIAAVVNVGTAHLGEFGSVEGISAAKGELVEALSPQGWAVLNADDTAVAAMAQRTQARLAWFSVGDQRPDPVSSTDLWVQAARVEADDLQRHDFDLVVHHPDGVDATTHRVRLPLIGAHHVANAAAAAAMAIAGGVDPALAAQVLGRVEVRSRWRMELLERLDGVAIINDAYNANPDSMAAALHAVAAIARARRSTTPMARAVAVLGDMLELGADAPARHREVGRLAATLGFDEVCAVGEWADEVVAGATECGVSARVVSRDEASWLDLRVGDVVVVKASRGLALDEVAEALARPRGDGPTTGAEFEGGGQL
ncbi:UDP-N-acetylmuramoyl-tripeptide--D-alanyl-D-alanine ligase [Aestuariimicrobium ganziense]|uniref:UDP-N-acetylmuramoyl-tripeptide--D-alanyl-D- alanine ligase n=1 Tax=Aestuariimicrobium ganziense TaxID=2773677 RepID=UPI001941577D|nr:UDP-N-acetylmuramoyl-tripeptide--D-alanyl-D-alanine ligase [Aestuariimicrobium ganziense]